MMTMWKGISKTTLLTHKFNNDKVYNRCTAVTVIQEVLSSGRAVVAGAVVSEAAPEEADVAADADADVEDEEVAHSPRHWRQLAVS